MARNNSSCVFCGARAVRSRVLPNWLDEAFPEDAPLSGQRSLTCKSCNRGWLSQLEERAMPLVEWMSGGRAASLAARDQETVALWGAKTIMMLQAIRDPERLPLASYREMYETLLPPSGFRVAIALRAHEGRWPYRFAARGSAEDHYRAELCVGLLVIRAGSAQSIELGSAAIEIWPACRAVKFPPAQGLVRAA